MTRNPILDDLHKTREKLLTEAGGTLEGLVAQLHRDERRSGREFVRPKRRAGGSTEAAASEHSQVDDHTAATP